MERSEFEIGTEFWSAGRQWRCTDVGTRVVVAIRIDSAEIVSLKDGAQTKRSVDRAEAEGIGWFSGPPYGVAEIVFDENDLEGCSIEREEAGEIE